MGNENSNPGLLLDIQTPGGGLVVIPEQLLRSSVLLRMLVHVAGCGRCTCVKGARILSLPTSGGATV